MTSYTLRKGAAERTRADVVVIGMHRTPKGLQAAPGGEGVAAAYGRKLVPLLSTLGFSGRLDEVAPERVELPSGSRVRVDWSDPEAPALPVLVQEVFGWQQAPVVAGRPLRLHLLSPASRVVAVTSDLASFWTTGYPGVRSDLRGRYPRHAWPEDPTTAPPSRRPPPRR